MQNAVRLRSGVAALLMIGAATVIIVACGDDEGPTNAVDAGATEATAPLGDASSDGSDPPEAGNKDAGPLAAKLQFVNAATDFGPSNPTGALRICYQVGPQESALIWAPLPPLPNRRSSAADPFPGVFIGTGGVLDTTGNDLSQLIVVPYLLSAESLQARGLGAGVTSGKDKSCEDLFTADAGGTLTPNVDYWVLPAIPVQSFLKGKSYILVLTGCAGDSNAGGACSAGFIYSGPGNGNLALTRVEVDRETAIDAGNLGVQFVNASPNLANFLDAKIPGEGVEPAVSSDKADAAAAKPLNDGAKVAFRASTALKQVAGITVASDFLMVNPDYAPLAAGFGPTAALSFGAPNPAVYANGKAFTFVAVGNPQILATDPNGPGGFNLKYFHYLGLPNDPPISSFDPSK